MSALITMATDNAKDRLFSKLGLNRHALGVVANMTALGIPLKTSVLLLVSKSKICGCDVLVTVCEILCEGIAQMLWF